MAEPGGGGAIEIGGPDVEGRARERRDQKALARAETRLSVLEAQIGALDTQQQEAARTASVDSARGRLVRLKGLAAMRSSVRCSSDATPPEASVNVSVTCAWTIVPDGSSDGGLIRSGSYATCGDD